MKKKKVFAICDLEEAYVVRLADYLNRQAQMPMQVLAFTRLDRLKEYARDNPIEILLISSDAMSEEVKDLNVHRVIILSDGEDPALEKRGEVIRKYQDSDSIARQVLRYAGEEPDISMPGDCTVYGIYSPLGRCGKTMLSLTIAQICSETGRTLYLNLEHYSGFETLFRTTYRSDMADLLYESKQDPANLPALLESAAQHIGDLDIIPPAFFPDDMREVTSTEWRHFLARAAALGGYRTIVLDIGPVTGDVTGLLQTCTRVFVPILADPVSRAKISQFEKNLEALSMGDLESSMTRVFLPELTVRNFGAALLDDLTYGRMGQFVRGLLEEKPGNEETAA